MKGRLILILLFLCCYGTGMQAQQVSLDTAGRIYDFELGKPGELIHAKINSKLSADIPQQRITEFFVEKISAAILTLANPNEAYHQYYLRLWDETKLKGVEQELAALKKWLEEGADPGAITYLDDFYKYMKVLRGKTAAGDWYKVNGASITGPADYNEMVSVAIRDLEDPGGIYYDYYLEMWGIKKIEETRAELVSIKKWLDGGATPDAIIHTKDIYKEIKALKDRNAPPGEYKLYDGSKPYAVQLMKAKANENAGSYLLELRQENLFNIMIANLFNDTYPLTGFNTWSAGVYLGNEQGLKTLLGRAKQMLAKNVNAMDQADSLEMVAITYATNIDPVIEKVISSDYFTNWIWLRGGEPLINPFEKKGKDTLTVKPGSAPLPRSRNISLLKESSMTDLLLNRILLTPDKKRDTRNIHYFRLTGTSIKEDKRSIEEPLRGDEQVKVNVHNTRANERLELVLKDTVKHNGMNNTMSSIYTGVGILGDNYKSFSNLTSFITTAWTTKSTTKSNEAIASYTRLSEMDTVIVVKKILDSLELDLKDKNEYNAYIASKAPDDGSLTSYVDANHRGHIKSGQTNNYILKLIKIYSDSYKQFNNLKDIARKDSLAIAMTYENVYESTLPPPVAKVQTRSDNPVYRTEILTAEKFDEDYKVGYLVRAYVPNGAKTDTLKLATFSTKNARLKWMVPSAGLMFTIPDQSYAINKFEGNETNPANITTKRKLTSFVVGLNIYVKPINMLDNHWGHSRLCPWYSRLSVFIGLDVPDIMYHFYPGISYDILPGLKLTGGAHLYRHTKYEIRNNVVQKQGDVLRGAGPFVGVNIDPNIVLRIVNVFNKSN